MAKRLLVDSHQGLLLEQRGHVKMVRVGNVNQLMTTTFKQCYELHIQLGKLPLSQNASLILYADNILLFKPIDISSNLSWFNHIIWYLQKSQASSGIYLPPFLTLTIAFPVVSLSCAPTIRLLFGTHTIKPTPSHWRTHTQKFAAKVTINTRMEAVSTITTKMANLT